MTVGSATASKSRAAMADVFDHRVRQSHAALTQNFQAAPDKIAVPEEEITSAMDRLAASRKESRPLETPRPAQSGDVLVIDFKGTVHGEALPGMAGEDHHLELGSSTFIEGSGRTNAVMRATM